MRRMPDDRRLSNTLDDPATGRTELTALTKTIAQFHESARRGAEIDREGTPDRLRTRWRSLLDPLHAQPADLVDPHRLARIDTLANRYIDGREPLLRSRIADGRIVDGHGDLLAEDIFDMPDGFRILDCLDFDDRLRYVDVLDDIAFLNADLVQFRCRCPNSVANQRIEHRPSGDSDATVPIADALAAGTLPWPDSIALDTTQPLSDTIADATSALVKGLVVAGR